MGEVRGRPTMNPGLFRKGGKSHLRQGLRNKQDSTHQAFSRVAVHSRHSELEASRRVMNITLCAFVPGSDALNKKDVEIGSQAARGGRSSWARPAEARA